MVLPPIRVCVNKVPPPHHALPPHVQALVMARGKYWPVGHTFAVAFLGGTPKLNAAVLAVMREWTQHANVSFLQAAPGHSSDIRVNYDGSSGSWSYIGTDCSGIPQTEQTMNLGWLTEDTDPTEIRRVVLHETGHAIGAYHEHSSPVETIDWNKPAVYAFYGAPPNNWDQQTVDEQVFAKEPENETDHTAWDKNSIMEYPIPAGLTYSGLTVGWNTDLSPWDIQFIGTRYPFPVSPPVVVPPVVPVNPPLPKPAPPVVPPSPPVNPGSPLVVVGRPAVWAMIGGRTAPAEFRLVLSAPAAVTLAVKANGGWGMAPRVAIIDAAGETFLFSASRPITATFVAGTYVIQVEHVLPWATGQCWVKATAAATPSLADAAMETR